MEFVTVAMIVLMALMKDKISVVSSPNSGWTQKWFILSLGSGTKGEGECSYDANKTTKLRYFLSVCS